MGETLPARARQSRPRPARSQALAIPFASFESLRTNGAGNHEGCPTPPLDSGLRRNDREAP